MVRRYVRTIEDMERMYYGAGVGQDYAFSGGELLKADAPLLSTTGGTYNAIYGRKVWSQLNQEFNAFSIMPKKPWEKSGWRVITGRPSFTKGGGVAENATLPDTTKPQFQEISTKPKTVAHSFDLSETAIFLADKDDALGDVRQVLKEEMGKHHADHINKMLLGDTGAGLAGNEFESIDRITGSATMDGIAPGIAAGENDIYTIDRSQNAWADGSNGAAGGGFAAANRNLSLDLMDDTFQRIWTAGGNPKVILTGYDTLMRVQQLLQSQQRFMESKRVVPTHNGVKGVPGIEAGFIVATYNGVPIIPSKDVQTDGISRMYYLDTDYMWFQTAKPTQYFESGIETGDPFGINRLGQEGLYRTMGENICSFFAASGQIRDLQ
jgi:hypothetical protein